MRKELNAGVAWGNSGAEFDHVCPFIHPNPTYISESDTFAFIPANATAPSLAMRLVVLVNTTYSSSDFVLLL